MDETDEEILKQSTDTNGQFVDVEDAANLATPWKVTGAEGGEVAVVFRDRVISDRIAFQYGTMTPEAAVSDFIAIWTTSANNCSMRARTPPSTSLPWPLTVKIGCSCPNSNITTMHVLSWRNGTVDWLTTQPSGPPRLPNS